MLSEGEPGRRRYLQCHVPSKGRRARGLKVCSLDGLNYTVERESHARWDQKAGGNEKEKVVLTNALGSNQIQGGPSIKRLR